MPQGQENVAVKQIPIYSKGKAPYIVINEPLQLVDKFPFLLVPLESKALKESAN